MRKVCVCSFDQNLVYLEVEHRKGVLKHRDYLVVTPQDNGILWSYPDA